MCGIVGYVDSGRAQEFLLEGLRRLEYRGYDSAGIATLSQDRTPTLLKSAGKISNLGKLVKQNPTNDHIGIGHTRWATHGRPSTTNAHPQRAGRIFLVHNGIIENYRDLKRQLPDYKFQSDTDSEVLAALIDRFYDGDLTAAVVQALKLVDGTYGIAVLAADNPDEIVAARRGSPLVIGRTKTATLIASDAAALLGLAKKAIYLNDGEVATITAKNLTVRNLQNQPIAPAVRQIETDLAQIQKAGYPHFLLKEIHQQPDALRETLRGRILPNFDVRLGGLNLTAAELGQIKNVILIGCGTAYHAGLLVSYYFEKLIPDVSAQPAIASEFRYRDQFIPPHSIALIVSQSGETADSLAALKKLKKLGVPVFGIVNVVGSTIAREAGAGVYVHAGAEISVASTNAFTSQVAALLLFGEVLGAAHSKNSSAATDAERKFSRSIARELARLPDEIADLLNNYSTEIQQLADQYFKFDHALYLGRGAAYPAALEGALKLKEISYIDANGLAAGELKHGPIALLDDKFFEVVLAPAGKLLPKTISNLEEIRARGGHSLAITNSAEKLPAENVLRVKTKLKILTPILFNVAQQLLAYFIAVRRGNDVDQPRNLAKSVTVE
ncbi:MAG: glutamine--fructose-6-phosphate transaminase (isomerizing) [Candidatus Nomurabacteria bacterium]|jgi:glucosamine--fructose-6-phosphate aminotransferase (isomerizing)|nr:glutamine--fructose-6-phosphate transaminase (isomerizing) [Candidatus Nomurabacteria bacterium]